MTSTFPVVRAGDVAPFLRWLRENGRPLGSVLRSAGLSEASFDDPAQLVPLLNVLSLFSVMAEREGPDIACRVVMDTSVAELGPLGEAILGAKTLREAILRACAAITRHSTHETMAAVPAEGGLAVSEQLNLNIDDEVRHLVQQYVAALIRALCRMTGYRGEPLTWIEITPHPQLGLAHLGRKLGAVPVASSTGQLTVVVPDEVLDRRLPSGVRIRGVASGDWTALRGNGSFARTARAYIEWALGNGEPSIEGLATAGGISRRTAQRRLAANGKSFSKLLDEVRRDRALAALENSEAKTDVIATKLGYSGRPAFVRAVRRWYGITPRAVRKRRQ